MGSASCSCIRWTTILVGLAIGPLARAQGEAQAQAQVQAQPPKQTDSEARAATTPDEQAAQEPKWNCDLASNDGCIIKLRTGDTLAGHLLKIVRGESVELRLLSGPRRRIDWRNIEQGMMASIGPAHPGIPKYVSQRSNSAVGRPVRQSDDGERPTASITIQGMTVGMRLQRRSVQKDGSEIDPPWDTICSGACREAILADNHEYRIIQKDGMYEEFAPRPWTKRLEVKVSPGVRSLYRGGVSLLVIGSHAVLASVLTAIFAWDSSCSRSSGGSGSYCSPPGRVAFGFMFGLGAPMTIAGIALTAKGNFGVAVHDPSPVPESDD